MPCGIVDEDSAQLYLTFGSSYKTRDCIVDALEAWWAALDTTEQVARAKWQIKMDNGSESRGKRTPFLQRMVEFCDAIGKPIQVVYYPPYQSTYNPIERCWGIVEWHWNGTKLIAVAMRLKWAKSMTWKGLHPLVESSRKVDQKGVTLSKSAMRVVASRLERHPQLPTWDRLIHPASAG